MIARIGTSWKEETSGGTRDVGRSVDVVVDVVEGDVTVFCRCVKERQVGDSAFTMGDVTAKEAFGLSMRGIDLMQSRRRSRLLDL